MKKFLMMLLPMAAMMVTGCRFDDSDIWDELNDHETRILNLENAINNDLASLSAIVAALNQKVYVESVATVDGGFTVTFTNGRTYNIINGEAGHTPVVSIKKDEDGIYYWTVDGEWLLGQDNEKVRADAIAPKVKLEDGKWYISTDNGTTWEEAGPAATDPIFKSAVQEDGYLVLTLQNDEVIYLPMAELMKKLQLIFDESQIKNIAAGETASVEYQVIVPEGESFEFDTFETNGYFVTITPADDLVSGLISVTAPDPAVQGKVLFILTGSKGSTFVKTVTINASPAIYVPTTYDVDYQAGEFTIAVSANVPYTSEIEAGVTWLHKGTTENTFTVDANNDEFSNRTANITFSAAGVNPVVVALTQSAKYAIVLDSQTATVGANDTGFEIAIRTNTVVTATSDVTWMAPVEATKAAHPQKVFEFTLEANEGEEREGHITFSAGDIQQVVTVTQQSASASDYDFTTIAGLNAMATATNTEYSGYLTSAVVSFVPAANQAVIKDATGSIILFKSNHGLKQGQTFTGECTVKLVLYNSLYSELTDISATFTGDETAVDPEDVTLAQLIESYSAWQNAYVKVSNVTITAVSGKNLTVTDGTNSYVVYTNFTNSNTVGQTINAKGTVTKYQTTEEIKVWKAADIEEAGAADLPTITASDITGVAAEGVTDAQLQISISNGDGWTPSVTPDGTVVSTASIQGSVITYSVNGNQGAAREGKITVTLSQTGNTSTVSKDIKVTQQGASSGDVTVLWSETWTGGEVGETPDVYGQEGTSVYGNGSVTYSVTSGDTATKLYNDNQMDGATTQLNLLLGKSGKTWTISGIPTAGATSATLKFYVNNGNTGKAAGFTVTTSTEGVTVANKTQVNDDAKPFLFTYDITIGSTVQTFDLTFTNGVSSNIRLDDISVEVSN